MLPDNIENIFPAANPPLVSIIAICYNHSRFVLECLESIRAQTYINTELIIMDDCSEDDSVALIRNWIEQYSVKCTFIAHAENKGVVKTLNEALSCSKGEYISMISTDDSWLPNKIEKQMAVMHGCSEQVAVVYSDAAEIDEWGNRLPVNYIEQQYIDQPFLSKYKDIPITAIPQEHYFTALVDGNFIPAMATIVRRKAVFAIGGYDERLTYEDYDMWLRLACKYEFVFCPGVVANYRVLSTSMVRSYICKHTPDNDFTQFLLHEKCWDGPLTILQRLRWAVIQWAHAFSLYKFEDPRARWCLYRTFIRTLNPCAFLLAVIPLKFTRVIKLLLTR